MCLAIPGKVLSIKEENGAKMAKTSFGGIVKQVCLDLTPEAQVGQYILVHVGFALEIVDEEEAKRTFQILKDLDELDIPGFQEAARGEGVDNEASGQQSM